MRHNLIVGLCAVACFGYTADGLEILDVGPPRTGSQTLYEVMGVLGYKALHSGYSLQEGVRRACADYICGNDKSARGRCLDTFKGYDVAMDEPFHLLYEEVLQDNPNAKFIFPVSSPEHWYQSYLDYLSSPEDIEHMREVDAVQDAGGVGLLQVHAGGAAKSNHSKFAAAKASPFLYTKSANERKCFACSNWHCEFGKEKMWQRFGMTPDPAVKQRCIANFQRHMERVQEIIPHSQLLLYNFSDGWGPLAEFLGKPVPAEPFPYVDKYHVVDEE